MAQDPINPYTPPADGQILRSGKTSLDLVVSAAVGTNVCSVVAGIGLRYLQFTLQDPYGSPVSDMAAICWIAAIAAGLFGAVVIAGRMARKKVVPKLMLIWFTGTVLYLAWFFANFAGFMLSA